MHAALLNFQHLGFAEIFIDFQYIPEKWLQLSMHLRYEKNPSETGALLNLRDLRANSPASDTYRSRTMSCTVQYIVTATAQPTIAFCEKAWVANEDWG